MNYSEKIKLDEFSIIGGNNFDLGIIVLDEDGIPFDLTNYTSEIRIAQYGNIRTIFSTISGTTDIPNSTITYPLTDTLTSTMSGKYVYQPKIIHTSGTKNVLKQGGFMVTQEIA